MYFAKVDILYRVLKVIVADQDYVDTLPGTWIPYDPETNTPKNYPGIGFTFDPIKNAFISPSPYPSWQLDDNCIWQAPIARPNDEQMYNWNEDNQSWELDE